MITKSPSGAGELHRHGTVLIPCVAGILLSATHSYSLGVMIVPLEQEFGWTRSQISSGPLIIAIIGLFAAPLVGRAVDQWGPRRIGLAGILLYCAALGALSFATSNILSWALLWVVLGLCNMLVIPTIWTAAVTSLFVERRGIALAITLCGASLCAAITPPLVGFLIVQQGWRGAYVGVGLLYAAVIFPLAWLFLRSATDDARKTLGTAARAVPLTAFGTSLRQGFASPAFIKLAAGVTLYALAVCALTANAVPILVAQGLLATQAPAIAGLIGIGSLVGRLGGGYLLDRLNPHRVSAVSVATPILSVALLLAMPGSPGAAMAGFLILGLSVGTELDACAYLAARHFGLRSYGTLFGAINGFLLFANGLAPMAANIVYDLTQSYQFFLWAVIPACSLSAMLLVALGSNAVSPQFAPEIQKTP
ncbi:MFS family permease [Sphingobium xenophagum]|uniref:MFS family permease n=1 Tax=Sphingobium xenophagum TaxID=121428 RepID=A0ABU1X5S1_SPHXE|nr:MFS transporter [Sphingobium xenophagum]MDR7156925.1 MFS family permease [Sphingobium xenophagum]